MPSISASAPGKIILFGEHAVVYGQPAIAFPVYDLQAKVLIHANPLEKSGVVHIEAPQIGLNTTLDKLEKEHPVHATIQTVLDNFFLEEIPACTIHITSTIPIASGLGSGAAITVALIRALSLHLGKILQDEVVSRLTLNVEKIHHGSPSGIDNTVISYRKPIYFIKGELPKFIKLQIPLYFVLADTGDTSKTLDMVNGVKERFLVHEAEYKNIFTEIGRISKSALPWVESGNNSNIGSLMNKNHELLCSLKVSTPHLDSLVEAAISHKAYGAKLVGAGGGGHVAALCSKDDLHRCSEALLEKGAKSVIQLAFNPGQ